jgi:hypothetical protein
METLFLLTLLAIATGTAFYFLPAIVAGARRARHFAGIFLINLLFGWTGVGWLGSLIWALVDEREELAGRVACPFCAEAILPAAKVCPHCRRDLPDSFTAAHAVRARDPLAPLGRGRPIPAILVLLFFLIMLASALYYRHVRFDNNNPTTFIKALDVL